MIFGNCGVSATIYLPDRRYFSPQSPSATMTTAQKVCGPAGRTEQEQEARRDRRRNEFCCLRAFLGDPLLSGRQIVFPTSASADSTDRRHRGRDG